MRFQKTLLGIAILATGIVVTGCNSSEEDAHITGVTFTESRLPQTADERASMFTNAKVTTTYSDGTTKQTDLAYNMLYATGDMVNGQMAGGYVDQAGKPILLDAGNQIYSDAPDGQSLIEKDGQILLATQYEYQSAYYGQLPSQIDVAKLNQDGAGKLTINKFSRVDTSGVNGLWITCAASLSPWNTHLSSEEYEPNAATAATDTQFKAFSKNTFGSETKANPYHYGYTPEVTVNSDGSSNIVKHYATGRISHELMEVMPDKRTAYTGDDGTNTGLFMYVADTAADLSAGTLYAGKWNQTSSTGGGSANITWIKLGHSDDATVKKMADTTKASDIFDIATTDPVNSSYKKIKTPYGTEWIR